MGIESELASNESKVLTSANTHCVIAVATLPIEKQNKSQQLKKFILIGNVNTRKDRALFQSVPSFNADPWRSN
jgi:hypothetical protein